MPIYKYRCKKEDCQEVVEKIQTISEGDQFLKDGFVCDKCGGTECERLMGVTQFKLQGGGWFAQGYDK